MPKYFNTDTLHEMNAARKVIYEQRELIYKKFNIDILDTDALSSLSIYEIISKYDSNYNINFSRNGEDAKSKDILIEQKASRVESSKITKSGKLRKNAGVDAQFLFHAMGDIDHDRYIFVARCKRELSVLRIYDISKKNNIKFILDHLLQQRSNWLENAKKDKSKMKRDVISIGEKTIIENIKFESKNIISGALVHVD